MSNTQVSGSVSAEKKPLYCICRTTQDDIFMVCCDRCEEWFHGKCVNFTKKQAAATPKWFCPSCSAKAAVVPEAHVAAKRPPQPSPTTTAAKPKDGHITATSATNPPKKLKENPVLTTPSSNVPDLTTPSSNALDLTTPSLHAPVSRSPSPSSMPASKSAPLPKPPQQQPVSFIATTTAPANPDIKTRASIRSSIIDALSKRVGASMPTTSFLELAIHIEAFLYKHFNNETNSKYKNKARSILFNIKDEANLTFYKRLISGEVSPSDLPLLTAEEMASAEKLTTLQTAKNEALNEFILPETLLMHVDTKKPAALAAAAAAHSNHNDMPPLASTSINNNNINNSINIINNMMSGEDNNITGVPVSWMGDSDPVLSHPSSHAMGHEGADGYDGHDGYDALGIVKQQDPNALMEALGIQEHAYDGIADPDLSVSTTTMLDEHGEDEQNISSDSMLSVESVLDTDQTDAVLNDTNSFGNDIGASIMIYNSRITGYLSKDQSIDIPVDGYSLENSPLLDTLEFPSEFNAIGRISTLQVERSLNQLYLSEAGQRNVVFTKLLPRSSEHRQAYLDSFDFYKERQRCIVIETLRKAHVSEVGQVSAHYVIPVDLEDRVPAYLKQYIREESILHEHNKATASDALTKVYVSAMIVSPDPPASHPYAHHHPQQPAPAPVSAPAPVPVHVAKPEENPAEVPAAPLAAGNKLNLFQQRLRSLMGPSSAETSALPPQSTITASHQALISSIQSTLQTLAQIQQQTPPLVNGLQAPQPMTTYGYPQRPMLPPHQQHVPQVPFGYPLQPHPVYAFPPPNLYLGPNGQPLPPANIPFPPANQGYASPHGSNGPYKYQP